MDELDVTDLRVIELALMNPRSGTPAAQMLEQLTAEARRADLERLPRTIDAATGALCFCQSFCEGAGCHCWCHDGESP